MLLVSTRLAVFGVGVAVARASTSALSMYQSVLHVLHGGPHLHHLVLHEDEAKGIAVVIERASLLHHVGADELAEPCTDLAPLPR